MENKLSEDDRLFLLNNKLARLATYSPEGFPHVVPLWYIYLNGYIYMATDKDSKKVRNIRRNPSVAVVLDAYEEYKKFGQSSWDIKGLMIYGSAEIIKRGEEYDKILEEYLQLKYPVYHEKEERWEKGEAVVLKIKPEEFCRWETKEKPKDIEKIKKDVKGVLKRLKKLEESK